MSFGFGLALVSFIAGYAVNLLLYYVLILLLGLRIEPKSKRLAVITALTLILIAFGSLICAGYIDLSMVIGAVLGSAIMDIQLILDPCAQKL